MEVSMGLHTSANFDATYVKIDVGIPNYKNEWFLVNLFTFDTIKQRNVFVRACRIRNLALHETW